MLSFVGIFKYSIDAYLSDFRGKATLPMLGGFMLQAATRHAEERGFGYSNMTGQKKVWVLTRMNIVMNSYPKNDTEINLHTWITDVNKLFTERCFAFEDHEGNYFGFARSLWAAIDLETRRPTNLLEMEGLNDYITGKPCPIAPASKIPLLKDAELSNSFEVKYSDIDINKHLNSIKYIEHFVDTFPLNMYEGKEIHGFEINYITEGQYGTTLDICKKETESDIYTLEMKDNDKTICSSRVTWKQN
ncbi:MAG: thioesterase [Dysgonomonas sp.]|nr:thioesterase [Dysgonomonas sp.]